MLSQNSFISNAPVFDDVDKAFEWIKNNRDKIVSKDSSKDSLCLGTIALMLEVSDKLGFNSQQLIRKCVEHMATFYQKNIIFLIMPLEIKKNLLKN